jgi:hypothetical protein
VALRESGGLERSILTNYVKGSELAMFRGTGMGERI